MAGLSPKLPLRRDEQDGYALNKSLRDMVQQNLKMLILTAPGERIMIPDFGVGLRNYLFENATEEVLYDLKNRIIEQAREFLPYIRINSVNFQQEAIDTNGLSLEPSLTSNYLHVVIDFTIDSEFTSETLIINL